MNDHVPPPADPNLFDPQFRELARPLYEIVNRNPATEPFPSPLAWKEVNAYRVLLMRSLRRSIDKLETVSCTRIPGLIGRPAVWVEYVERAAKGIREDGDINELVQELNDRTEDRTLDTEYELVPDDLLNRSVWFYRALQRSRPVVPPFDPNYGAIMCRILAMGMSQPHELTDTVFPYLIRNPPLGFIQGQDDVYSILVA